MIGLTICLNPQEKTSQCTTVVQKRFEQKFRNCSLHLHSQQKVHSMVIVTEVKIILINSITVNKMITEVLIRDVISLIITRFELAVQLRLQHHVTPASSARITKASTVHSVLHYSFVSDRQNGLLYSAAFQKRHARSYFGLHCGDFL